MQTKERIADEMTLTMQNWVNLADPNALNLLKNDTRHSFSMQFMLQMERDWRDTEMRNLIKQFIPRKQTEKLGTL